MFDNYIKSVPKKGRTTNLVNDSTLNEEAKLNISISYENNCSRGNLPEKTAKSVSTPIGPARS